MGTAANVGGSPWNSRLANSPPVPPNNASTTNRAASQSAFGYGAPAAASGRPVPAGYSAPRYSPPGYQPPQAQPPQAQPPQGGARTPAAYPPSAYPTTNYRGPATGAAATDRGYAGNSPASTNPFDTPQATPPYTAAQPNSQTNNR
jgi:hypothetical protein